MNFTAICDNVFERSIHDYHITDDVNAALHNPYPKNDIEHLLYHKNWIDTVQWHLEDLIRDPEIDPVEALFLKRRIDASNQERTDMVEYLDAHFLDKYRYVSVKEYATINTESPAWAIDRYSILALKIYHMQQETLRSNVSEAHVASCKAKLEVLLTQKTDLAAAINTLLGDIENGKKYMKVYKQMKMYNDEELNPVLYKNAGK